MSTRILGCSYALHHPSTGTLHVFGTKERLREYIEDSPRATIGAELYVIPINVSASRPAKDGVLPIQVAAETSIRVPIEVVL